MSIALQEFVVGSRGVASHFARNVLRPPVPGEENDTQLESAGGIISNSPTRSSGSYRSHISGRSLSSSRSHSSGKSQMSAKSRSSGKSRSSSSSSAADGTSKKPSLDQTLTSGSSYINKHDNHQVPLEGSTCQDQQPEATFIEDSLQPAYLKWAENLESLLIDRDGVRQFRRFLEEERDSALLNFLFACKGLVSLEHNKPQMMTVARAIYRRYVKGNRLGLQLDIKRNVVDRIRRSDIDSSMYSEAVFAVEDLLRNDAYPAFLKSDVYLTYIQLGGSGSADSSGGSSDDAVRQDAVPSSRGALATVLEEQELTDVGHQCVPLALTEVSLAATQKLRDSAALTRGDRYIGSSGGMSRKSVVNPYHVSYAPVSAQDSELQSLSSDAPTDDTATSHTTDSSSADGDNCSKSSWKRNYRLMRRSVSANQQTNLNHPFIPRTAVMPRDCDLSEKDPAKFAALLIERLQQVKRDRDSVEKVMQSINQTKQATNEVKKPPAHCLSKSSTTLPSYPLSYVLFPSGVDVEIDLDEMIGAQNILEEHVSRVWDDQATTDNEHDSFSRTALARLPAKPFHRRLMQPLHPSPNVSNSGMGCSFSRFASSSFCQPDFDVSCCSEMDCDIDNDQSLNGLQDRVSSMSHHHRLLHSTPKSKSHILSRFTASQSDSEMWADCGSSLEKKPVSSQWSAEAECVDGHLPHYSSQPNLPAAIGHNENGQLHKRATTHSSELIHAGNSMVARHISMSGQSDVLLRHDSSNSLMSKPCRTHGNGFLRSKTFSERLGPPPPDANERNDVLDLSTHVSSATRLSFRSTSGHRQDLSSASEELMTSQNFTIVGFYLGDEPIPYRTRIQGDRVTLGQFKQLVSKRGNYRYFFKKASDEFDTGVVLEEVTEDDDILPLWDSKIIAKVERKL